MRLILMSTLVAALAAAEPAVQEWTTLAGERIAYDAAAPGRPHLLVFWASWCGPCRAEMPGLVALHRSAGDQLRLVSFAVDETAADAQQAATAQALPYPVVSDPALAVADRFQVESTPTLILIGADGRELARGKRLERLHDALVRAGVALP